MPNTLYDKIWNEDLVHQQEDGTALLFVDRHLVHEVTSPQAFEGLRNSKRKVRHPKLTLAVADHNVPTTDRSKGISDNEEWRSGKSSQITVPIKEMVDSVTKIIKKS